MVKLFSLLFLLALKGSIEPDSSSCNLELELTNIRNQKGTMYIFLYNYENQWPHNPYKFYKLDKSEYQIENQINFVIQNLEYGKYAVSLLDDENRNEDLDRFLGLPEEGFGFSNNVRPLLSIPRYQDLLFEIKESKKLCLNLQYIL